MTNYEWIKSLDIDEMAKLIDKSCRLCIGNNDDEYCHEHGCNEGIKEWLNQNVNPMPKLEVGDVLTINHSQINQRSMYVYLGDDTVWVTADSRYCFLSSEMKGNIVGIIRKGKGRYNFDTMDFWNSMEV